MKAVRQRSLAAFFKYFCPYNIFLPYIVIQTEGFLTQPPQPAAATPGVDTNKDFQQVVDTYAASLYRLACSYCGSHADAEDVVQEVFLKYLQSAPEFPTEQKLRAWLMTVTANKCKDLLRSPWRRNRQPLSEADAVLHSPDDPDNVVQAALLRLSPKSQAVIYLYYYEELTTKEIGKVLKLSETAVRSRLFQARKHLKKLLEGD